MNGLTVFPANADDDGDEAEEAEETTKDAKTPHEDK